MKILVMVLAAATIMFTGTALYYARAVRLEIARPAQGAALATPSGSAGTIPTAMIPARSAVPESSTPDAPAADDPARPALARHRLELLRDPATRAQLLEEARDSRYTMWQVLAPYVGLSDEELDRFARQLAERDIDRRTRLLECETTPGCDTAALRNASREFARLDRTELLTPEQVARFQDFSAATAERGAVSTLAIRLIPRGELLTQDKVEVLTLAVVNERRRFIAETGRDPQGDEYHQRLVRSVAGMLTAGQLAEFEEALKEQQRRDAARREDAGGQ
jgi:hypothetical protein